MHITHVSLGADRCIKKGCVVNSPQALYVHSLGRLDPIVLVFHGVAMPLAIAEMGVYSSPRGVY